MLRARGGMLLRTTSSHKLARTCGPPGCTLPTPYPVCGPKTPDSLTVTLSGITFCDTSCHPFQISSGATNGRFTGPVDDINGDYCLRASGANTWQADFTGDFGDLYGIFGSGITDCTGTATPLDTLRISVQRFINIPGVSTLSRFYVRALVGFMSGATFVPQLAAFYYYDGETSDLLLDCRASVTVSNQNAGCGIFDSGGARESYPALGTGGTATVVGCCQCPGNGTGCCDTINVSVSGDIDDDYTFIRTGNHWNGEFGSIIHCVRGRWEMIVKNSDGTKTATWTAGDGITSMECPPTGDPADWGDPALLGVSSVSLDSIDCGSIACASDCDFCCDVVRFDYLDPDGNPAWVEFTKDSAGGEPCSWELTDSSFLVTDANLSCADGVYHLFTVHDGVIEQSFDGDAAAHGCVSDDLADWTTIAGPNDLTAITLSGCA